MIRQRLAQHSRRLLNSITGRGPLLDRIAELERQHWINHQSEALLCDLVTTLQMKVDAITAMLADSRTCHSRELARANELERRLAEYREADRAWITRQVTPRVSEN